MANNPTEKPDYEVGYGRPPKHTRFPHQKRRAGPRKPKRKTLGEYMMEELHGPSLVRDPKTGKIKKIPTAQQIARNTRIKALQNDPKALQTFFALEGRSGAEASAQAPPPPPKLMADELAIMARFAEKFMQARRQDVAPDPTVINSTNSHQARDANDPE